MTTPDDVHVVVPTMGDRPDLLGLSVDSLLSQTYPARITVITRGETAPLHRRWKSESRVKVVAQRSTGLSAAINEAWIDDGWSSDYTAWLGDDDALPPWSIEAARRSLHESPSAAMVHGDCLVVDELGEPRAMIRNRRIAAALAGYGVNLLAQPGTLLRTDCVRRVGGLDEGMRYAMDVDLFIRLRSVGPIKTVCRQLGVFRAHADGLSTAGAQEAYVEARIAARRARSSALERSFDVLAWPTTRVVSRLTAAVGRRGLADAWRPTARDAAKAPPGT